jgi:hypothetical protein
MGGSLGRNIFWKSSKEKKWILGKSKEKIKKAFFIKFYLNFFSYNLDGEFKSR